MIRKTCAVCGKDYEVAFNGARKRKDYPDLCSPYCTNIFAGRQRSKVPSCICPVCGEEYKPNDLKQRRCSKECRLAWIQVEIEDGKQTAKCRDCGKVFMRGELNNLGRCAECVTAKRRQGYLNGTHKYRANHTDITKTRDTRNKTITKKQWQQLCKKYRNKCLACGSTVEPLTMDHVVPLSVGGTHALDNLQPLCKSCNSRKGNKTIDYRPTSIIPAKI